MKWFSRLHSVQLSLLLLVYLATLWVVAPWGNFPLNDDWVYARACVNSANAGRITLTKLESAWAMPQIVTGALVVKFVGFSHTMFRVTGIVSLVGIVLMTDLYLRRVGLSPAGRLIAAATLVFNPVMYLMSLTFMTDLPFLVLWLLACYAWDEVFATGRKSWVLLALTLTIGAMAERQFALFIAMAVGSGLALAWLRSRRQATLSPRADASVLSLWGPILGSIVVCGVFFVLVSIWWKWMGGYQMPIKIRSRPPLESFASLVKASLLLALAALPLVLILRVPPSAWSPGSRWRWLAGATTAVAGLLGVVRLVRGDSPLLGNLISRFGIFGRNEVLLGDRPVVFDHLIEQAVTIGSIVAVVLAVPQLLLHAAPLFGPPATTPESPDQVAPASPDRPRFGFILFFASALYMALVNLRPNLVDRYLLPIMPALLVALAVAPALRTPVRLTLAWGCVLVFAGLSITITADYFRWNEARWSAADALVRGGVAPERINAGYEWNGWNLGTPATVSDPQLLQEYDYVVSFGPDLEGFQEVDSVPWKSIWPPHDRRLSILKKVAKPAERVGQRSIGPRAGAGAL